ncbi:ornithine cyclodeaminase family protein [Amycolatopsis sp. NPDC059027]|uniref:ornithine cyclodeaminase family protein n=1 Tax=unclassified Amycolatopsis TaxID=2618356 RepID=UPI00366D0C7F
MPARFSADEVRAAVPMPAAVDSVRDAFLDLADDCFVQPQRLAFGGEAGTGTVLVMSAYHRPTGAATVKTTSVVPGRDPLIQSTLVWTTAERQLVAEAASITTLRTGAASGVATDLLAPRDASRLTLIGAGAQAADQVRAVAAVRDLRALTVFSRGTGRAHALLAELTAEFPGLITRVATSADDAVADAEIVCCATSSDTPVLATAALPERVHVNAIGSFRPSMRELPADLLATASAVVVDQLDACLDESGEIRHAVGTGLLDRAAILELGSALRTPPGTGGRTVFKSVGVAAQDWAIARLLDPAFAVSPPVHG